MYNKYFLRVEYDQVHIDNRSLTLCRVFDTLYVLNKPLHFSFQNWTKIQWSLSAAIFRFGLIVRLGFSSYSISILIIDILSKTKYMGIGNKMGVSLSQSIAFMKPTSRDIFIWNNRVQGKTSSIQSNSSFWLQRWYAKQGWRLLSVFARQTFDWVDLSAQITN